MPVILPVICRPHAAAVFSVLYFFQRIRKKGAKRERIAMTVRVPEIGRVKKMERLPCEIVFIRHCFRGVEV